MAAQSWPTTGWGEAVGDGRGADGVGADVGDGVGARVGAADGAADRVGAVVAVDPGEAVGSGVAVQAASRHAPKAPMSLTVSVDVVARPSWLCVGRFRAGAGHPKVAVARLRGGTIASEDPSSAYFAPAGQVIAGTPPPPAAQRRMPDRERRPSPYRLPGANS
jgi:hypothetical protein